MSRRHPRLCPFCAAEPTIRHVSEEYTMDGKRARFLAWVSVGCALCDVHVYGNDRGDAIDRWNGEKMT